MERDAAYLVENNFEFTKLLCHATRRHGARFVYASSAATYGDGAEGFDDEALGQVVRALYAVGVDEFTISAADPLTLGQRNVVRDATADLIGLEVVAGDERRITLRCLLDTADVSIRQTTIQLQLVALSMQENAAAALAGETDRAERVRQRDDEADSLYDLVHRYYQRSLSDLQTVTQLGIERGEMAAYYHTARQLERVADHAEKTASIADRLDDPDADRVDSICEHARRARRIVERASNVLVGNGDTSMAFRALDDRDALDADLDDLDRALYEDDDEDAYLLGLALDSVRRTADYGGNVAELMVQSAARNGEL